MTSSRIASGAADRPGRAVERGEEAVADDLDLVPAEALELAPDDPVVVRQQALPAAVAELGRQLRRADDVGEQDGREHAARLGRRPNAGHEVLDLGDDRVLVAGPDQVVGAGQLDVLRAGDVLGEVPSVLDAEARGASRWMTSVGTRIVGRTSRTSLS